MHLLPFVFIAQTIENQKPWILWMIIHRELLGDNSNSNRIAALQFMYCFIDQWIEHSTNRRRQFNNYFVSIEFGDLPVKCTFCTAHQLPKRWINRKGVYVVINDEQRCITCMISFVFVILYLCWHNLKSGKIINIFFYF